MASTSTQQAAAVAHSTDTGSWLGRLPLEIREIIYQYALVDKVEHRMKSAEVSHSLRRMHPLRANTINL